MIFDLFVKSSADPKYEVRLAALKFWAKIIEDSSALPHLEKILPQLVPILVENTVYTPADYAALDQAQLEEDNASVSDDSHSLVPRFHKSSPEAGEDSDYEDGDDDAKSAWGNVWTVRKSAALALDSFCMVLG